MRKLADLLVVPRRDRLPGGEIRALSPSFVRTRERAVSAAWSEHHRTPTALRIGHSGGFAIGKLPTDSGAPVFPRFGQLPSAGSGVRDLKSPSCSCAMPTHGNHCSIREDSTFSVQRRDGFKSPAWISRWLESISWLSRFIPLGGSGDRAEGSPQPHRSRR